MNDLNPDLLVKTCKVYEGANERLSQQIQIERERVAILARKLEVSEACQKSLIEMLGRSQAVLKNLVEQNKPVISRDETKKLLIDSRFLVASVSEHLADNRHPNPEAIVKERQRRAWDLYAEVTRSTSGPGTWSVNLPHASSHGGDMGFTINAPSLEQAIDDITKQVRKCLPSFEIHVSEWEKGEKAEVWMLQTRDTPKQNEDPVEVQFTD